MEAENLFAKQQRQAHFYKIGDLPLACHLRLRLVGNNYEKVKDHIS